jgi:hypothetical protein
MSYRTTQDGQPSHRGGYWVTDGSNALATHAPTPTKIHHNPSTQVEIATKRASFEERKAKRRRGGDEDGDGDADAASAPPAAEAPPTPLQKRQRKQAEGASVRDLLLCWFL